MSTEQEKVTPTNSSLMTPEEWNVYTLLNDAFTEYCNLPQLHQRDLLEFIHHSNALKALIMARPVARELITLGREPYCEENVKPTMASS